MDDAKYIVVYHEHGHEFFECVESVEVARLFIDRYVMQECIEEGSLRVFKIEKDCTNETLS